MFPAQVIESERIAPVRANKPARYVRGRVGRLYLSAKFETANCHEDDENAISLKLRRENRSGRTRSMTNKNATENMPEAVFTFIPEASHNNIANTMENAVATYAPCVTGVVARKTCGSTRSLRRTDK